MIFAKKNCEKLRILYEKLQIRHTHVLGGIPCA